MLKYLISTIAGTVAFLIIYKILNSLILSYTELFRKISSRTKNVKFEPKKILEVLETYPKSQLAKIMKLSVAFFMFLVALLILQDVIFSFVFGIFGYLFPTILISQKIKKQKRKFEEQLIDVLGIISNSIRSGASLQQAFEIVVKETKPPISTEFSELIRQINLGISVDHALQNMSNRINSRDLSFAILAMNVAREYGGNLGENLLKISYTIRERGKIQNKLNAITSQGRLSAWIITFVPFLLLLVLNFMEPSMFGLMFKTTIGKFLLLVAVFMVAIGNYIIMKIVSIDI